MVNELKRWKNNSSAPQSSHEKKQPENGLQQPQQPFLSFKYLKSFFNM